MPNYISAPLPDVSSFREKDLHRQLMDTRDQVVQLQIGLKSARRIGMAHGIVMTRLGVTENAAWNMIARVSQLTNRKVRDIAEQIIFEGQLPSRD